jgi:hypothetical protein
MTEKRQLEFFLLRYVPNAVRDEPVNIGLVMTESGGDGGGFAGVHFTKDWRRVRCLHPDVDVEWMEALAREVEARMASVADRALLLHQMSDSWSNAIQLSPVQHCVAEDPAREMERLAKMLIETPPMLGPLIERKEKTSGVSWIRAGMSKAFEDAGVWRLLAKNLPAAPYSVEGDPLRFDFAYALAKELKLFQAVSFVTRPQDAVEFALHYAKIAPTIERLRAQKPVLTAVVEDSYDATNDAVIFASALMKEENIRVARLREMPGIAEVARREMQV